MWPFISKTVIHPFKNSTTTLIPKITYIYNKETIQNATINLISKNNNNCGDGVLISLFVNNDIIYQQVWNTTLHSKLPITLIKNTNLKFIFDPLESDMCDSVTFVINIKKS
jgi:hypothetical protein